MFIRLPETRHDHDGVEVGLLRRVPVGGVQLAEVLLGLFLVGEGLNHLQPLNDLLDLAIDITQGRLLLLVIFPAPSAQCPKEIHSHYQQQGGDQKELPVDEQHHGHQTHKHQAARAQRNYALLQSHLYVIRVIG